MLEEGLRSPTFSPSEAAQGLLSFVRFELPDGGSNAEKRFFGLFLLLCDRFFGPLSSEKDKYRHENGGWLSRQQRWDQMIPRNGQISPRSRASRSLSSDPVVQLLCGIESLKSKQKLPTLIEAISSDQEPRRSVRVQFPFYALPKPTQELISSLVQSSLGRKPTDTRAHENAMRLFSELLQVKASDQFQLQSALAQRVSKTADRNRPLSLSLGQEMPSTSAQTTRTEPSNPTMLLSMLEFFLFTFIRYPTAPPMAQPAPQGHPSRAPRRSTGGYGDSVYTHLFTAYLNHFLPLEDPKAAFRGYSVLPRNAEVLLRIVIEFWLFGTTKVTPYEDVAKQILERRKSYGSITLGHETLDLSAAYDLVKVNQQPAPEQVQKCLRALVFHVLKDPLLPKAVKACSKHEETSPMSGPTTIPWCISPQMTVLSQGVFTYIATTFRHAPIHVRRSAFSNALDMWLLWLEPWNVEYSKSEYLSEFCFHMLKHISDYYL